MTTKDVWIEEQDDEERERRSKLTPDQQQFIEDLITAMHQQGLTLADLSDDLTPGAFVDLSDYELPNGTDHLV